MEQVKNITSSNLDLLRDILFHTTNSLYIDDPECEKKSLGLLKSYFRGSGSDPISAYQNCYLTYARRYVLPNLIKNYFLIQELNRNGILSGCKNIVDVGSGPGSFALAYYIWSQDHPGSVKHNIKITMIDAVAEFLHLFAQIWECIDVVKAPNIQIQLKNMLVKGRFLEQVEKPDLIILSNSLTEILRNPRVNINHFTEDLIRSGAGIAVIDHDYETSSSYLKEFAEILKDKLTSIQLSGHPVRHLFYEKIDLGKLRSIYDQNEVPENLFDANVKFLNSIWLPLDIKNMSSTLAPSSIVAKYKEAWEKHDFALLRSLFTENAIYQEKEDESPFVGIESICAYWKENAERQRDVEFYPTRINCNKDLLTTEWWCSFFRKDLSRWVYLVGTFKAKLENGKICRFSEKFEKRLYDFQEELASMLERQN